jgi:hypothetical protein
VDAVDVEEPTPRQNLARWAADRGYPALRFRSPPQRGAEDSIGDGSANWDRFLATARDVEIEFAVEAARDKDWRR